MGTIVKEKSWDDLQKYGWVRDMTGVPQSPVYHAEGDVATHTRMVIKEMEGLREFQEAGDEARDILWTSALLHDIEKRSTTMVDERGSIVSPGHAKKGAMTSRQILYRELPIPFETREQVTGLVRYHGLPIWVFEKADPVKALLRASLEANTHWLYLLAKADILGRICKDQDELLYRIELFRELCEEQDCWGKPKGFASDLGKFRYFQKEDQSPDFDPFNDVETEVTLLSGLPGSGKDHYLHRYQGRVISLDDMRRERKIDRNDSKGNGRLIQEALEMAKQYLRQGVPFVWNATNITLQMREQLVNMFAVYNPKITIIYLEVPFSKLLEQNRNRDHPIPQNALDRLVEKLEVPKLWEAHEVKYVCDLDATQRDRRNAHS